MELVKLEPTGYCKGVEFAIKKALEIATLYRGKKIYCINQLVHNDYVNQMLSEKGIEVLNGNKEELVDSISEGIVIFSAHGTDRKLIEKAKNKGLTVVDTVCPWVNKVMVLSTKYIQNGYDIIYIGKKKHPEAEALISISDSIHLIENINDLEALNITNKKIAITNQTTISINDLKDIYIRAKEIYPEIIMFDEICNSTRTRQEVINNLDSSFDGLIIVGDNKSNNTKNLYNLGKKKNIDTIMIDSFDSLSISWLTGKKKIGVASGTSTPSYLVDDIIQKVKALK